MAVKELKKGKVILTIDAPATNTGTTVLEVLEKSPGVTIDRNDGITFQGKAGVFVMIDDKPTYLSGVQSGMKMKPYDQNK
jgi:hypothetical protein